MVTCTTYALKVWSMVFSLLFDRAYCLSFADRQKSSAKSPLTVQAVSVCGPCVPYVAYTCKGQNHTEAGPCSWPGGNHAFRRMVPLQAIQKGA